MRTILLMAQQLSVTTELSFSLEFEYIQEALKRVIIHNPKTRAIIYKVFEFEDENEWTYDMKGFPIEINSAYEASEKVLEKLSILQEMGVDIYFDGIYSLYREKLPKDYKQIDKDFFNNLQIPKKYTKQITQKKVEKIYNRTSAFDKLHDIKRLKKILNETVLNQENAVEAVCDTLVKNLHIKNTNRPSGIFFFLGAPATGKTFLAQTLQENINGYDNNIVFDMTQFTNEESGGNLFGTGRHWGNAKTGTLTAFVKKNPKTIIIFDEFEKAHTAVQANLLSILSGGYLEDACGWCKDGNPWTSERSKEILSECENEDDLITKVDFTQTIVIFTSNLGKEVYNNQLLLSKLKNNHNQMENMMYDALSREEKEQKGESVPAIIPEMLSRLRQGSMVLFNRLKYKNLRTIASAVFEHEIQKFMDEYKINISYEDEVLDLLLLEYAPSFDVRAVKSSIAKRVCDTITDEYMQTTKEYKNVKVTLDKDTKTELMKLLHDADSLLHDLTRKNKTVSFETGLAYTKTIQKISFENIAIKTLYKAKDFGEDGISIEVPEIAFSDIAGHDFVKTRLQETVGLLKDFDTLQELGVELPKGMLLYGPPGTGKTMLAKAIAHEADLPFISTTGNELLQEGRIKKLFSIAKEYAPSILFIDEIDTIPERGKTIYTDSLVNELLTQMDGFDTSLEEPIFIIAATNRKDEIDTALLRSGRIDIHIEIAALDKKARKYFIDRMLSKPLFNKSINIKTILKFTTSLNGSDLQKVERESILFMYKNELKAVTQEILIEQINTIKYGRRIEDEKLDSVLEETAYHEAGHAVLSKILLPLKRIEQVTVMPRNDALGFVSFSENDEYYSYNIDIIRSEICVSLAGRASQIQKFGTSGMDTGASSDLKNASRLAYLAISRYGMDEELRNLNVGILDEQHPYKNAYKNDMIFSRMNAWISELTQETKKLVEENWNAIEALAKVLVDAEVVDEKQLDKLLKTLK